MSAISYARFLGVGAPILGDVTKKALIGALTLYSTSSICLHLTGQRLDQ
jgi:hypothetical protein